MSRHRSQWKKVSSLLSLALAAPLSLDQCLGAEPTLAPVKAGIALPAAAPRDSRIDAYRATDGTEYFALSLTPQVQPAAAAAHDLVILFDTSASQNGAYRDKALAALQTLLAGLSDKDQVQLYSLDLHAVPMSAGFAAPRSAATSTALEQLRRRAPLGSTDLGEGMNASLQALKAGTASRRVIYIGDGQNNAGLAGAELSSLIDSLAEQQISVTSYAIGPDSNNAFLAALANLTGGALLIDGDALTAPNAGQMIQAATSAPVYWPQAAKLPAGLSEIYPAKLPPLRADRDTVVIGRGALAAPTELQITAASDGQPVELKWNLEPRAAQQDNAYLAQLVDAAKADRGYGLPILGTAGLQESSRLVHADATALAKLGHQALKTGRNDQAGQLVKESLRRDPENVQALAMQNALNRAGVVQTVAAQLPAETAPGPAAVPPLPAPPPSAGNDLILRGQPAELPPDAPSGFVGDIEARFELLEQKIRGEVMQGLQASRNLMATDPHRAEAELKLYLDRVDATADLRAAARAELRDMLTRAIRESASRGVEWDTVQLQRLQREQAAQAQKEVLDLTFSRQAKVKQLIDRFDSLLDEGRYQDAELRAAKVAFQIEPSPTTINAVRYAYTYGMHQEYLAIREAHQRAVLDSFLLADKSSIPFPDDPPIVYPDADFWRDITAKRAKYRAVDLSRPGSNEEKINKALEENTEFDFQQFSLEEIQDYIRDRHKIEIQRDQKALDEATFDMSTRFDKKISGIKLRSALRLLLNDKELSYVIKNDVLLITTKAAQETDLVVKVYPVADLVIPITNGGGINPFGLGGGQGGGGPGAFGGGGQGGGGQQGLGGFGGGGFGGGGGGGGQGGGGGFFNVPDPIQFPNNVGGLQAWAVPETLKLTPKTAPAPAAVPAAAKADVVIATPAPVKLAPAAIPAAGANHRGLDLVQPEDPALKELTAPAKRIELTVAKGQDAEQAWSDYFAGLGPIAGKSDRDPSRLVSAFRQDASVRETVRQLMRAQDYKQTAALIRAALRNGYGQPWMYEALSLAMIADDQPTAEIERALMSSVDYARSPQDILYAAAYMARVDGLKPRALKLLRRVSELDPSRPEPYQLGLVLAEQTGDVSAVEWAALGFLGKAWTQDQIPLANQARRLALGTLEALKKAGKADEAAKFEKALNAALSRDLIVRVSWTGDADIDLLVEEPTGTTCSARTPRTISGGVMIGDNSSVKQAKNGVAAYSEDYVVPQGFAGTYRIMLKRIWGKVTGGKVSVEVISNYGTDNVERKMQLIPLGENPALVIFDLKAGRRVEKLAAAQVAVAANEQVAMGQAVLAQQIAGMQSNSALSDLANNRQNALNPNQFPFFRGAVGYMPVITTLPEGTNMQAQAVVSADRRYVRITATPLFSLVPQIDTFNFQSGGGTTQTGTQLNQGGIGGGGGFP